MWQLIKRDRGDEKIVTESQSYQDVFAKYERHAKHVNARNEKGEYRLPNVRISIRKETLLPN